MAVKRMTDPQSRATHVIRPAKQVKHRNDENSPMGEELSLDQLKKVFTGNASAVVKAP